MSDNRLSVAFLWHMHQPYYRDPMTGIYRLPWVRLHGTKDYLDMAEMLRDFPSVRQNFNLVPSLLEQIVDYTDNGATDLYLELSRKRASDLNPEEKRFVLENFFLAHWENMIRPFPRYYELLGKRGMHINKADMPRIINIFTEGDFRDLQVLFNLCWIDPYLRGKDPFLRMLYEKARDFSEDDKDGLIARQLDILKRIIPEYRELSSSGQAELSFSPFYHPILPLLCDTDISRTGMPMVRLPGRRFSYPADAQRQIEMGIDYFQKVFDFTPKGMWPSEGSVSEEVLGMVSRLGLKWVATDEGILSASLSRQLRDGAGNLTDQHALYRPYEYEGVSIVFRDHTLSDLIGFVYSQWDARRAAEDLIGRLLQIQSTVSGNGPHLVSIILDGENAWEHYKNDGRDFFLYLYEGLARAERLETVTISEFIERHPPKERLKRLFPGSWINSNFGIWIGHEEDNLAWDYLSETRDMVREANEVSPGSISSDAWKALYAAEGSDWNWWYGDEHSTDTEEDFDELFRLNLMKVYRELGRDVPDHFYVPILREDRGVSPMVFARGFIKPTIDGIVTNYYEWYEAAKLDVKKTGGSMHKAESLIGAVYYGFNRDNLYLRADPSVPFAEFGEGTGISVAVSKPESLRISCKIGAAPTKGILTRKKDGSWVHDGDIEEVAIGEIFEICIPFQALNARENDEVNILLSVFRNGEEIERCPWRGYITFKVPSSDFEAMMWY